MKAEVRFLLFLSQFFLEWEVFQTKVVEKFETHILCSITFFFFFNRAVYEIMWKNIVELVRPQMTIWRIHIESWLLKNINKHSEYNYFFPTATVVARLLRHVTIVHVRNIACLVKHYYWTKFLLHLVPEMLGFGFTPRCNWCLVDLPGWFAALVGSWLTATDQGRGSNPGWGGGEIFRTRPDRPGAHRSLLYDRYRVFPGGKAAGAWR
jgi:hypothetical protein